MSNIALSIVLAIGVVSLIFLPICFLSWLEYTQIEFEKELYHKRYGEYF